MKLRTKIFLPIAVVLLLLGTLGYALMDQQLDILTTHMHRNVLHHKQAEIMTGIDLLSQQLVNRAALFTQLPTVIDALRLANTGAVDEETNPQGQAARELLRTELAAHLAGHAAVHSGEPLKLHFYLANGRSLARLWRHKQLKRDGKWVDLTDKVSHFRSMVRDMQAGAGTLRGIELGKAGFVVRGMIPIDDDAKRLGAVEVLMPLNPLLDSAVKTLNAELSLWMPVEHLTITTRLQDPEQYPVLDEQYVRVYSTQAEANSPPLMLLHQGLKHLTLHQQGQTALGAFPVWDYTDNAIGILVYQFDVTTLGQLRNQVSLVLLLVLAAILVLIGIVIYLIVASQIAQPLSVVNTGLKTLAQGQLSETELTYKGSDEIAEIVHSTCQLQASIRRTITQANAIALGDYSTEVKLLSDQDQLGQALLEMVRTLRGVIQQANAVAAGDYTRDVKLLSAQDELGQALLEMTRTLRELDTQRQQQDWLKTGQTQLNDCISGEQTVTQLAENILNFIAPYVNAAVGACYLAEYHKEDETVTQLVLLASYAYTVRKQLANQFRLGEGVIGQAALERKVIMLTDSAVNYASMAAEPDSSVPNCTIVVPFSYEEKLKGVVELAAHQTFSDIQIEFLTQIVPSLAIAINTAQSRARMQTLLDKMQSQPTVSE